MIYLEKQERVLINKIFFFFFLGGGGVGLGGSGWM